ncbi:transposase [Actinomadura coerulea]|uniref:transposase n=1 Tax=Actinomadura coerulea TaxID=46159 RepID=UPI003F4DBB52
MSHEPDDHALGRSRGGLSTKLHLACEQGQKPLSLVVTAGQRGDAPQFEVVMAGIRVARPEGGRPRTRPERVRADKAYSSRAIRTHLRRRGIAATIPVPDDQAGHRPHRRNQRVAATPFKTRCESCAGWSGIGWQGWVSAAPALVVTRDRLGPCGVLF